MVKTVRTLTATLLTLSLTLFFINGYAFFTPDQKNLPDRNRSKANKVANTAKDHNAVSRAQDQSQQDVRNKIHKSDSHWRSRGISYGFHHPGTVGTLKSLGDRSSALKIKKAYDSAKKKLNY